MKKITILLILLLNSLALSQFPLITTQQKPMHGLQINKAHPLGKPVAAWFFNEGSGNKIFDLSGNGNTGTLQGTTPSWTSGKYGSAVLLPGTDEYINCGSKASLDTDYLTIAAWIKSPDPTINYGMLVTKSDGTASAQYELRFNGVTAKLEFVSKIGGTFYQVGAGGAIFNTALSANIWYFVAVTFDGSVVSYYLNGIYDGGYSASGTIDAQAAESLFFGTRGGFYSYFQGLIDHVMIYNCALSASEMAQLCREPFCMFEEGLPVSMMYDYAVGVPVPVFYYHYINHALPFLPIIPFGLYCYIRRRKCAA